MEEVERYYDGIAATYDQTYGTVRDAAENEAVAQKFREAFPAPASVLDLGCGTGLGRQLMGCEEYLGLDLSGEMLARARVAYPGDMFRQEAIENFEADKPYDVVVSLFGMMSHLADPGLQIRRLAGWASRGAFLMFYARGSQGNARHIVNIYPGAGSIKYVTKEQVRDWMRDAFQSGYVLPFDSGFEAGNGCMPEDLAQQLLTEHVDSELQVAPRYWIAVGYGRKA